MTSDPGNIDARDSLNKQLLIRAPSATGLSVWLFEIV